MKVRFYDSMHEFELSETSGNYEEVSVVRENGWIKCDLMTECKRYQTALRRFFKALENVPEVYEWRETLEESTENGYFKMDDLTMADGSRNPVPGYVWGVEEYDGCWYVYVNVRVEEPADPAAEAFPELCKAVHAAAEKALEDCACYIKDGYFPTWSPEHRDDPDRGLREWSTAAKWAAYQAGTIDRADAVQAALERGFADVRASEHKRLERMGEAAQVPALSSLSVIVEWARSRTWGANPTTRIEHDGREYKGHASGCGYDKRSAAVAEALNQIPAVRKVLYQAAEDALKGGGYPRECSSGCVSWGDLLGYGSGYSILPYFEGGVGVNCFWSILDRCGYEVRTVCDRRYLDVYSIERREV